MQENPIMELLSEIDSSEVATEFIAEKVSAIRDDIFKKPVQCNVSATYFSHLVLS